MLGMMMVLLRMVRTVRMVRMVGMIIKKITWNPCKRNLEIMMVRS